MCGIVGVARVGDGPPAEEHLLGRMNAVIAHRGPDDDGIYIDPNGHAGLASRRLAILDRSAAGHQPMASADGRYWVAYNGEVYNYADYYPELKAQGYTFRGHSDTEVLLALYQAYGPAMLSKLRGMFAFAIWDEATRQLFIARDRIGIKPLYYTFCGGQLLFGSEIKSLLQHPQVPRLVDEHALYHYLSFLTAPAPHTLFKGIKKLPAGHFAVLHPDGRFQLEEYWDVFDEVQPRTGWGETDYTETLIAELREAIRLRMVSDVPFGVFLSGGVDSTTNAALMAERMERPVQSFSIGYEGFTAYNEFDFARRAAQAVGADHHEMVIGERHLLDFLPALIYHQDEPIADPVCVPLYYVSTLARGTGTIVVQVGEGADELFSGYTHWLDILRLRHGMWNVFTRLPASLRRLALAAAPLDRDSIRYEFLRRATYGEELFWGGAEAFGEARKNRLLAKPYRQRLGGLSSWDVIEPYRRRFNERAHQGGGGYVNWMAYLDLNLRLPELLLMRVDKMTMATSVEARVPFLDHIFVGLAMSIPEGVKVSGGTTKHLFKQAVRGIIPDDIIDRPKQGFRVPIREWLQAQLGDVVRQKLLQFAQRTDYFRPEVVHKMVQQGDYLTWYLFNFALWHELWIEGEGGHTPPTLETLGLKRT